LSFGNRSSSPAPGHGADDRVEWGDTGRRPGRPLLEIAGKNLERMRASRGALRAWTGAVLSQVRFMRGRKGRHYSGLWRDGQPGCRLPRSEILRGNRTIQDQGDFRTSTISTSSHAAP